MLEIMIKPRIAMSFGFNSSETCPNNYLEVQEFEQIRRNEKEMSQLDSSSITITQNSLRCNHCSEINTLKKVVIGLTICFLIFIRVENERLIKEIHENKYIFNQHIDYTIGYIQV
jgi:hypothetical protein